MTTLNQLRKAAFALPETEEGTHYGMAAFSVRGSNERHSGKRAA